MFQFDLAGVTRGMLMGLHRTSRRRRACVIDRVFQRRAKFRGRVGEVVFEDLGWLDHTNRKVVDGHAGSAMVFWGNGDEIGRER